jgi:hypothetical protein
MDRKRFIDSISLSISFFLFCITLLTIQKPGYIWFLTFPIQFFWALAGLSFILFVIFSLSLFVPSIMDKYEELFIRPPVSKLLLICWVVFLGILWLATFIGLVGGVISLANLLPEILRLPALIATLIWPIIVVIALLTNIGKNRLHRHQNRLGLSKSLGGTDEINAKSETSELPTKPETDGTITQESMPSVEIVLEETRRRLDFQFEQLDSLNTKSGIVLGVAGVIFTLLVTSLLDKTNTVANLILAKIALIPIFASLVVSFVPMYIIKWSRPPNLERLRSHYLEVGWI